MAACIMIRIEPIPAFADNYIWMISSDESSSAAIVDPGEASPVLSILEERKLHLAAILLTHHHGDHIGGVKELTQKHPVQVWGPSSEGIPTVDCPVGEGDTVTIEDLELEIEVLDVPGHTAGHVAYFAGNTAFVGDTVFAGGCGRIFEGTPEQMLRSIAKIGGLAEDTSIYCAHEYTLANLRFACEVEPENLKLQHRLVAAEKTRAEGLPTVPSNISEEL